MNLTTELPTPFPNKVSMFWTRRQKWRLSSGLDSIYRSSMRICRLMEGSNNLNPNFFQPTPSKCWTKETGNTTTSPATTTLWNPQYRTFRTLSWHPLDLMPVLSPIFPCLSSKITKWTSRLPTWTRKHLSNLKLSTNSLSWLDWKLSEGKSSWLNSCSKSASSNPITPLLNKSSCLKCQTRATLSSCTPSLVPRATSTSSKRNWT